MEKPKFEHENPARESMNNFTGHMPGGFYRPDGKSFISQAIKKTLETHGAMLKGPEEAWPERDRVWLKSLKIKMAIQKDIDCILAENPQMLEDWQTVEPISAGGLSYAMREHVLRPLYVPLRKKYTEDELST